VSGGTPLRVLMVTPRFPPYGGGVETHVHEVSRRLVADAGIQVEVLTTDPHRLAPPTERASGVQVTRVSAWPPNGDLYWSPAVWREVRRTTADIVHCQGYHTFVPLLGMLAARQRGTPYVLTFHSGGHSSRLRNAARPLQLRLMRPLLRSARRLIAVSDFEANLIRRAVDARSDRVVVIPNGIDLPPVAGTPPARDPSLIVSAGRLERYKGHDRVIRAFARLRDELPAVRLRVLGTGPDDRRLQDLAAGLGVADAVEIGGVPHEEVRPILERAAVVALLSEYESHGLAAHEALALGCRLVVSDTTALAELRGVSGVRTVGVEAEPSAIAAVLAEQLEAGPLDQADRHIPTWDECARRLAEIYREVARAARS
jgi:glycosyltransferase involved in cell wall biosynthesis